MRAPFSVLTVCTGNVARSALAERLLARGLADLAARAGDGWAPGRRILVSSAGTDARVGEPMTPETAALAVEAGAIADGHAARQLEPQLIETADLVLALSRDHRRQVVTMTPLASRFTFALPEFARGVQHLAGGGDWQAQPGEDPAETMARIVETVALRRGIVLPPEDPAVDDIVDPYLGPPELYARAGRQIRDAVAAIVDGLERLVRRLG